MLYSEVERKLKVVFAVKDSDMGVLRGRIRHLRTLGLLSKPGSGNSISYERPELAALAVALALGDLGLAPARAVKIAAVAARRVAKGIEANQPDEFVVVTADAAELLPWPKLALKLASAPSLCLLVNVSRYLREAMAA